MGLHLSDDPPPPVVLPPSVPQGSCLDIGWKNHICSDSSGPDGGVCPWEKRERDGCLSPPRGPGEKGGEWGEKEAGGNQTKRSATWCQSDLQRVAAYLETKCWKKERRMMMRNRNLFQVIVVSILWSNKPIWKKKRHIKCKGQKHGWIDEKQKRKNTQQRGKTHKIILVI